MTATAAVKIEKTSYKGWPNCCRISNGTVELILTADVGPRIMRYAFLGGQNLLKEYADQLGNSGEKEFQLRGGHRIWVAPERLETNWALDNGPAEVTVKGDVAEARQPVDSAGLEKRIIIKLAPWALTMMAPGGRGITGFPPRGTHPEALLPANPLVMWADTDLSDQRWGITNKYLTLKQDPQIAAPQKIGLFNEKTWAAYLLGAELFIKRMRANPAESYPAFGYSFETFTNNEFLELETLGPIGSVASGASVEHIEHWSLHRNIRISAWSDEESDRVLLPLLK